jgi:hypothetical protein
LFKTRLPFSATAFNLPVRSFPFLLFIVKDPKILSALFCASRPGFAASLKCRTPSIFLALVQKSSTHFSTMMALAECLCL